VKVDKFLFPVDFVVMDMEEDAKVPLILGRPFMKTAKIIIDVDKGKLKVCVQDEEVSFDVFEAMKHPSGARECFRVDVLDEICTEQQTRLCTSEPLMKALSNNLEELNEWEEEEVKECWEKLGKAKEILESSAQKPEEIEEKSSKPQKIELKQLPPHLKYVFLAENGEQPVILSSSLTADDEEKVVEVLRANKGEIGWTISDLKGISPSYCMHKIHMEQDFRPIEQPQRRLNPTMKEVVKKKVQKLLEAGMIYPISDSVWVSPVQVVLKKGGMTVIHNEKNELIPTRTVTGWRMCIDYQKLNQATRKDHFPLPFMDQML